LPPEGRTDPGLAVHPEPPAHQLDQAPTDGQPELGTAETAERRRIGQRELAGQQRLPIVADVDTRVGGLDAQAAIVLLASSPLVVGSALLGWWRGGTFADLPLDRLLQSSVRAPGLEELLCRGLLVGAVAVAFGVRSVATGLAVIAGALVFGKLHVPWSWGGVSSGWAALLVTGLGGAWYAWLMLLWGSLWPPMLLYATMSLAWLLGQTRGGAGGGVLVDNLLRVATIVVATVGTPRSASLRPN
jgi:membrane protease YdiL (CAAX protease family)